MQAYEMRLARENGTSPEPNLLHLGSRSLKKAQAQPILSRTIHQRVSKNVRLVVFASRGDMPVFWSLCSPRTTTGRRTCREERGAPLEAGARWYASCWHCG